MVSTTWPQARQILRRMTSSGRRFSHLQVSSSWISTIRGYTFLLRWQRCPSAPDSQPTSPASMAERTASFLLFQPKSWTDSDQTNWLEDPPPPDRELSLLLTLCLLICCLPPLDCCHPPDHRACKGGDTTRCFHPKATSANSSRAVLATLLGERHQILTALGRPACFKANWKPLVPSQSSEK